jgi:hypothetical protein
MIRAGAVDVLLQVSDEHKLGRKEYFGPLARGLDVFAAALLLKAIPE